DTKVSDAGLVHLKGLKQLYSLGLSNTRVTGAGLVRLKDLKELETLDLDGLKVSDADLAQLKDLPPPAWFDEREVETGHGGDRRAPADERASNGYASPKLPRHLSTVLTFLNILNSKNLQKKWPMMVSEEYY